MTAMAATARHNPDAIMTARSGPFFKSPVDGPFLTDGCGVGPGVGPGFGVGDGVYTQITTDLAGALVSALL